MGFANCATVIGHEHRRGLKSMIRRFGWSNRQLESGQASCWSTVPILTL
jgi:hypothetical protein